MDERPVPLFEFYTRAPPRDREVYVNWRRDIRRYVFTTNVASQTDPEPNRPARPVRLVMPFNAAPSKPTEVYLFPSELISLRLRVPSMAHLVQGRAHDLRQIVKIVEEDPNAAEEQAEHENLAEEVAEVGPVAEAVVEHDEVAQPGDDDVAQEVEVAQDVVAQEEVTLEEVAQEEDDEVAEEDDEEAEEDDEVADEDDEVAEEDDEVAEEDDEVAEEEIFENDDNEGMYESDYNDDSMSEIDGESTDEEQFPPPPRRPQSDSDEQEDVDVGDGAFD